MNSKGYNGNTPLILAANKGHAGIAKLLLKHPHIKVNEQVNQLLHIMIIILLQYSVSGTIGGYYKFGDYIQNRAV